MATSLARGLPSRVLPDIILMRDSVRRFRAHGDPRELERAFAFATVVVAALHGDVVPDRPDLDELRWLSATVPEFAELLAAAADEAEHAVTVGAHELWRVLGLRSEPPSWSPSEREAAKMVFACACSPSRESTVHRLQSSLRRVAAGRFAQLLCGELANQEDAWVRVLDDAYGPVRHRCAHRTKWRSRPLAELVRTDDNVRGELKLRLERWIADGGGLAELRAVLEAALAHAGTPARFA
jgi:hypothetical protein